MQVYRDTVNWHIEAEKDSTHALLDQHRSEWLSALQARGINAMGEILPMDEDDEE